MIGRSKEIQILNEIVADDKTHFIAIYGRRRIGKTFLIRETFSNRFAFQHAGIYEGTLKEQLFAFDASLKDAGLSVSKKSKNWMEAFENLKELVRISTEQKKIIFIDELSWMDTPRSDFMKALEHFWNGWASARTDVVLIVCTSATSWMLSNIIHNKGGLYNRLTEQIHLKTFNLSECEEFVKEKGIAFTRVQILQYYMIFGGVPYYWDFLQKGLGLEQNIDRVLFAKDAPLKEEFRYLYASIFRNPEDYIKIIQSLAKKKIGLTRDEIISESKLSNSGTLSSKLDELESCGFIRKYYAFGMKAKGAIYQLIDNFTIFYYSFMKDEPADENFFSNQLNMPALNTWMGYAFERVVLMHIDQIKAKLGIQGVLTEVNSWHCKANPDEGIKGSQIDLLIVRKDQVINLCEMKYSGVEYTVTDKVDVSIRNKIHDLKTVTKTKYAIYPTLITTYGVVDNAYALNMQSIVTMEDLFRAE